MRRIVAILVLLTLLPSAVFGGIGSDALVVCFGGPHAEECTHDDHAASRPVAGADGCSSRCDHQSDWAVPRPVGPHDHDCTCTDVDLAIVDLIWNPRLGEMATLPTPVVSPAVAWVAPVCSGMPHAPPPMCRATKPHLASRLAIVRSTRLLV